MQESPVIAKACLRRHVIISPTPVQPLREKVLGLQCLVKVNREKNSFCAYLLEFLLMFIFDFYGINPFHACPTKEVLTLSTIIFNLI